MTLIRKLPYVNPDSAGLTPLVSTDELTLFNTASLLTWWRADTGVDANGWVDRKAGKRLNKNVTLPTLTTLAAYNNQPSLLFGGSGTALLNDVDGLFPTTECTIVLVGRQGVADNAFIIGDRAATPSHIMLQDGTGVSQAQILGTNFTQGTTYSKQNAAGPRMLIWSMQPGTSHRLRQDRGRSDSSAAMPNPHSSSGLIIGASGNPTTGPLDGGEIAEVMVLNTALDRASNAALLATIESYLGIRYAITAP